MALSSKKRLSTLTLMMLPVMFSSNAHEQHFDIKNLWNFVNIYDNKQGDYFKFDGRLQADSAWFDASEGEYEDALWRRFRFGMKGKFGATTAQIEADIDLNGSLSDSYNRLTYAGLSWILGKNHKLQVLKHDAKFTLDGSTSSKKLYTPQRNNLTNNLWFTAEYFTGISVTGKLDDGWGYTGGVFSSDDSDGVSISEASYFSLITVSKKLESNQYWQGAQFTVDIVYNDEDEDANTRDFSNVYSFSSKVDFGDWDLWTDVAMGNGYLGQSDIWGVVVMPLYKQSETLQWAIRYTYLDSDQQNGLRLGRYESSIVSGRGDTYHEFYGGINWLLDGHKVKFQAGIQYTDMNDDAVDGGEYEGWGLTTTFRTYW